MARSTTAPNTNYLDALTLTRNGQLVWPTETRSTVASSTDTVHVDAPTRESSSRGTLDLKLKAWLG